MKHTMKQRLVTVLLLALLLTCAACNATSKASDANGDVWANATYQADTTFGTGASTVQVEVQADDKAVTFTLKTDKTTLADALLEHDLIAGEQGDYGLYVKVVNGITADYDADGHYWSLCKNGGAVMTGADTTEIKDGEHYEFVYAK